MQIINKLKKIIIALVVTFSLLFLSLTCASKYLEHRINVHLSQYGVHAQLENLNKLTLKYNGFELTCKLKIEDKSLVLIPSSESLIARFLPKKIRINQLFSAH